MKRNVIFSLAMTAALLTSAFAAEVEFPERVDNAAIHYWAAVALLPRPENQEEIDAIKFIEDKLPSLPPAALEGKEVACELLRKHKDSMRELHEGASKSLSDFDLDYGKGNDLDLPHLRCLRDLAKHALSVAKLHEMEGHPESAAEIYGDLLAMVAHLDEDKLLLSGFVGWAVTSMTANGIEGFLSREPAEKAIEILL